MTEGPLYTPSELDRIRREIENGNAASRAAAQRRGIRVNPRIAAAKLK